MRKNSRVKRWLALILCMTLVLSTNTVSMAAEENGTEVQAVTEAPAEGETEAADAAEVSTGENTEASILSPESVETTGEAETQTEAAAPEETEAPADTEAGTESESVEQPGEPAAEPSTDNTASSETEVKADEGATGTETPDADNEESELTEEEVLETEEIPEEEEVIDYNAMSVEELYTQLSSLVNDREYDSIVASLNEELRAAYIEYLKENSKGELIRVEPPAGVNFSEAAPLVKVKGEVPDRRKAFRSVSAQSGFDDTGVPVNEGLSMGKDLISYDAKTGEGLLELEAFVTGNVVTEYTAKPLDIVLVLDQSGSMEKSFGSITDYYVFEGSNEEAKRQADGQDLYYYKDGHYYKALVEVIEGEVNYQPVQGGNPKYKNIDKGEYYYKAGEQYYRVQVERNNRKYTSYYMDENGKKHILESGKYGDERIRVTVYQKTQNNTYKYSYRNEGSTVEIGTSEGRNTRPGDDGITGLYVYGSTDMTRQSALKNAAQSFVNNVRANAEKTGAEHKIAVVGFASGTAEDLYYGNTEILTARNSNGEIGKQYGGLEADDYKNALVACGDTLVDSAINALDADGATQIDLGMEMAQQVLVNNPVKVDTEGKPERNRVVVVLSDGAPSTYSDWSTSVADAAVEYSYQIKNAQKATVYSIGIFPGADASETNPSGEKDEDHFMQALSSNYLNARGYYNRKHWYSNKGERNPNLKGKSYYLSASDSEGLNDVFEQISNEVGGAELAELGASTVVQDIISPYFELNGSSEDITVFTADCIGADGNNYTFAEKTEITDAAVHYNNNVIHVSNFDFSANYVGTDNGKPRGKKLIIQIPIQYKNESSFGGNNIPTNDATSGVYSDTGETCYGNFEQPAVSVPVDYQIASKDQTIYFTNAADLSQLLEYETRYKADGVKNKFVTITYELKQGDQVLGTLSIPAATSADNAQWTWEGQQNPVLEACAEYTLECKVTPIEEHKETSEGVAIPKEGVAITPSEKPGVHVLFPEVQCLDTTVFLGESADLTENVKETVNWKDKNEAHTNIPEVSGTKPTLTITPEYVSGTAKPGEGAYYPEEDSNFKLKVMAGEKDITSQTTITPNETKCEDCYKPATGNEAHDFTVHVVAGTLDISKKISGKGNAAIEGDPIFTFKIEYTPFDENSPYQAETFYRTIRFSENEDIKGAELLQGLPKGTYQVTELTTQKYQFDKVTTEGTNCKVNSNSNEEVVTFQMGKDDSGNDSTEAVLGKVQYENEKIGPGTNTDTDTVVNRFEYKDGKWTITQITEPGKDPQQ